MSLPARFSASVIHLLICLVGIGAVLMSPVSADEVSEPDPAMVERLKAEVIKEIKESGVLQQEIEAGIEAYIARERESRVKAQQQARLEQEQLASHNLQSVRRYTQGRDHLYGNPDATITLVEYSDFECPYCKRFHNTPKALVEQYQGQVNWVYRHFPLSFHNPGAQKQAEASECVFEQGGDAAFWTFADTLYQQTRSGGNGFPLGKLGSLVEKLGLDRAMFQQCLDSGKYADRVKEDLVEGKRLGITGTPGNVLINNVTGQVVLKVGAHPSGIFVREIDTMLSEPNVSSSESAQ
ncbi:DsbA family protein [Marinobacterium sediminicola]|uniref:Protein-disulfide isomerase n=1 Tax=Marinobacterium sediminicola TaxID=518898 RepID=A0ABY1S4H0_9GAMM|nr:thioredoxin domain-containing protein [Marinobacterium sediminicola]ULG68417.1 DsbA family protein [Marinobacterium sediminicola]SMR78820.1 Protein-disulfide isomerase [Marinobacterium sediminicola]